MPGTQQLFREDADDGHKYAFGRKYGPKNLLFLERFRHKRQFISMRFRCPTEIYLLQSRIERYCLASLNIRFGEIETKRIILSIENIFSREAGWARLPRDTSKASTISLSRSINSVRDPSKKVRRWSNMPSVLFIFCTYSRTGMTYRRI
jgi:hypothetical protein